MSRGNLPSEPSLSPPEDEVAPETVIITTTTGINLAVHLEWDFDYNGDNSWSSSWVITKVEVDDFNPDDEDLREEVWEALF